MAPNQIKLTGFNCSANIKGSGAMLSPDKLRRNSPLKA
jgi:hypothetical protein